MQIHIVVAVDHRNGFAKKGEIPWENPDDRRYFIKLTKGPKKATISGSTTFETFPKKLAGRVNIVLSRYKKARAKNNDAPDHFCKSLQQALDLCDALGVENVYVIGGLQPYQEALFIADWLHITQVSGVYNCDTLFPEYNQNDWVLQSTQSIDGGKIYVYKRAR